jgi:integrase/recombinase XerC
VVTVSDQTLTWPDARVRFLENLEVRGLSPHTRAAYRRDLDEFRCVFIERFDHEPVPAQVGVAEIRAFLATLFGKNDSASIARKASTLRVFFRYLHRIGAVSEDPAARLRSPKRKLMLPRALSIDDAFRVVENPEPGPFEARDRAILEVLYGTGLRVAELCALDVADVDHAEGLVRVRRGKGGKERIVPIGSRALAALAAYRELRVPAGPLPCGPLFVNDRGGRLTPRSVQRQLTRAASLAGVVGVSPHVLRHSYATHLHDSGLDLRSLQELLGHASLAATQIYTKVSLDYLKRVYDDAAPPAMAPEPDSPAIGGRLGLARGDLLRDRRTRRLVRATWWACGRLVVEDVETHANTVTSLRDWPKRFSRVRVGPSRGSASP